MYEQKTRGGTGDIFVFRFAAAAGNAHDFDSHFARGKRPRRRSPVNSFSKARLTRPCPLLRSALNCRRPTTSERIDGSEGLSRERAREISPRNASQGQRDPF